MNIIVTPVPYNVDIPVVMEVGKAFKSNDNHFYLQKSDSVLHVLRGECINSLFVNELTDMEKKLEECPIDEFREVVKFTIYELSLYHFWNM